MVKFTFCKNFAEAETKEAEWSKFCDAVTKSVGYDNKDESIKRAMIVGGVREDESRGRADNVQTREIVTIDYDDLCDGVTFADIGFALQLGLGGVAFVAYSTFRSTDEAPRFRVMVPLSRRVTGAEYQVVVQHVVDLIRLGAPDDCSFTVNQGMFLASHKNGLTPWSLRGGADAPLDVDAIHGVGDVGGIDEWSDFGEADDLSVLVANRPLDLSPDQVATLLASYPAEGKDYDEWLRVGMAIYHQTEGNGYGMWRAWSEKSPKHDERHMKTKWRSFGGRAAPVTMASIISLTGGMRGGVAVVEADSEVALSLEEEAEQVTDRATYSAFKKRVQSLNEIQLPPDIRSLLASTVHEVYAKAAGMGLREVKTAMKPIRAARAASDDAGVDCPAWLDGWVYAEADCLFVNTAVSDYAIKREAFRAKFDRMPEAAGMETDAATFALNMVQIPTVVRPMYWPGQPKMFATEGKDYVNSYHTSGSAPCDVIDADGQGVVDLFVRHVRNTIADEREGDLLMDFMGYILRNPAHRVKWGLLLWGIEGNGKTYFYQIMQHLLGRNATLINTSMIERPFNDWAVGARLIGIEEIRIAGTNKGRVLDQLKPMISNSVIAVEPKGASRYHAPNFASYLMTTNHRDAVPMSDNDRRYCVIFTRHEREADLFAQHGGRDAAADYFRNLFDESERRIDAIGRFLIDRPLSAGFDPNGRAPITAGASEMRSANISDERQVVEEAIEDHACDIVGPDLLDVTHLNSCAVMAGGDIPSGRALGNILRDMGYTPIAKRRIKVGREHHFIWFNRGAMGEDAAVGRVRDWHSGSSDFSDVPF